MPKLVGYARVSTPDQSLQMQIDELIDYGIPEIAIFSDVMSSREKMRPGYLCAMTALEPGDTLIVWKLDRLHRTTMDCLKAFEALDKKGVTIHSLTENIDYSTSQGKFVVSIMAAMSQMERDQIAERTKAGLARKKARGERVSRMPKINERMWNEALHLIHRRKMSVYDVGIAVLQDNGTPVTRQAWYKHKPRLMRKESYPFIYNEPRRQHG